MRRQVETILKALLAASLAASLLGCAASRPPQRIQDAIHTANRYMPEYVAEANKALADAEHPDRERLVGIGDRLAEVLDALDRWAAGQEKTPSAGWRTRSSGDRDTCATATGDNGSTGRTKPRTFSARTRTSST